MGLLYLYKGIQSCFQDAPLSLWRAQMVAWGSEEHVRRRRNSTAKHDTASPESQATTAHPPATTLSILLPPSQTLFPSQRASVQRYSPPQLVLS